MVPKNKLKKHTGSPAMHAVRLSVNRAADVLHLAGSFSQACNYGLLPIITCSNCGKCLPKVSTYYVVGLHVWFLCQAVCMLPPLHLPHALCTPLVCKTSLYKYKYTHLVVLLLGLWQPSTLLCKSLPPSGITVAACCQTKSLTQHGGR